MRHEYKIKYEDIQLLPLDSVAGEKYRQLRCNPDVRKWFTYKGTISAQQQKEWFEKYLENPRDVMFALYDESGAFLGCNSIYDIDEDGSAEYGRLIVDPAFSGKGYGYKATCAAVKIAKDCLKLKKLRLEVYNNNYAAIKTYKKAGFTESGLTKDNQDNTMLLMEMSL